MNVTYYGHSCFSGTIEGQVLLVDAFITLNDLANSIVDIAAVKTDYIFISQGERNHITDYVREMACWGLYGKIYSGMVAACRLAVMAATTWIVLLSGRKEMFITLVIRHLRLICS